MTDQKRDHFRLEYPVSVRPTIIINGESYSVVDLSEKGVKFSVPKGFRPAIGLPVRATIRFHDKSEVNVAGKVLRIVEGADAQCVLVLTQGVPLPKMMEEQRFLIQKFKK